MEGMKTIIKAAAALFVMAVTCGIATLGLGQDYSDLPWGTSWEWPDNNFTNRVAVPTATFYANTQAAVANDQQYRVREEGTVAKGATALQSGPRIAPRPPTGYLQTDPWVQPDHAWDMSPNAPYIDASPGETNDTVIDETVKR